LQHDEKTLGANKLSLETILRPTKTTGALHVARLELILKLDGAQKAIAQDHLKLETLPDPKKGDGMNKSPQKK
jgi:hypothetical protein